MDSKFLNRQLLCWLSYDPYFKDSIGTGNRVCYLYPRYIVNHGKFEWIDSQLNFPTFGRIAVRLNGQETAEQLYQRLGPVVSARINTDPQANYNTNNYYQLRYNPAYGRDRSEIWLETFDSSTFYEIKESNQDLNSILRYHECDSFNESDCFSNYIILRIGNMLYGPFEPEMRAGVMKLNGLERYDFMIGGYPIAKFDQDILTIRDQRDRDMLYALPTNLLPNPQESNRSYDMIDQPRLVEMFLDRVRAQLNLSRQDIRPITTFCQELFKGNQSINLSEQRLQTVKQLLPLIYLDRNLYQNIIELTLDNDEFREHFISTILSEDGDELLRQLPSSYVDDVKSALLNKTQDTLLEDQQLARAVTKAKASAAAPVSFDLLQDGATLTNIKNLIGEGNNILDKLNAIYSSLALAADPDIDMDMAVSTTALNPTLIAHFMDVGGLIVKLCANVRTMMHSALGHDKNLAKNADLQALSSELDALYLNLNQRLSDLQGSKILAEYTKNYHGVTDLSVKLEEISTLAGTGAAATQEAWTDVKNEAANKVAQQAAQKLAQSRSKAATPAATDAPAAIPEELQQELTQLRKALVAQQDQNRILQSQNKQLSEELSLYDEGRVSQLISGKKNTKASKNAPANPAFEQTTKALDTLSAAIESKQQEAKELNLKIIEQNSAINERQQTLEALNQQIEQAKSQQKEQQQLATQLEGKLKTALSAYQDKAAAAVKLIDAKIIGSLLGAIPIGVSAPVATAVTPTSAKNSKLRNSEASSEETMAQLAPDFDTKLLAEVKSVDNANKILDRVTNYLNKVGHRNLERNDVANYLICITQGFITTFAGEPGTGKTSLCNLLARALGLARLDGADRFSEVSVERGWTSLKDMIGYYNPLTKRMEKSNAEIFDAFMELNREAQWASDGSAYNPAKIAPYFILLDEANLSPIEHYWAAFFRNCDFSPLSERTISLGGNANWLLPDHLRFLATVNFDHTTEELSPRFLDRSWVITLEPSVVELEPDNSPDHDETMVPFASLMQAFSAHEGDKLDASLEQKWEAIQAIFADESCAMPLRPRNIRMVYNYCVVAARCMSRNSPTTRFAPLDYAVAQKILPTINGSGERYRILIEKLIAECGEQNMPLCARHLKRIQRTGGAELGFYQFFAR